MENKIKELSELIFDRLSSDTNSIQEFFCDLDSVSFKDFLGYNFSTYSPSYLDNLMFSTKKYWEKFSLQEWIDFLEKMARDEFAIQYCISFLYKYIEIDSLKLFANLANVDDNEKNKILKYFKEFKGTLAVFDRVYLSELLKFDLRPSSFESIKARLLKEGGEEAIKIRPNIID